MSSRLPRLAGADGINGPDGAAAGCCVEAMDRAVPGATVEVPGAIAGRGVPAGGTENAAREVVEIMPGPIVAPSR